MHKEIRFWVVLFFFCFLPFSEGLWAQQEKPLSITAVEAARRQDLIRILKEQRITFEERPLFAGYGGFGSSIHVLIPGSGESGADGSIETLVLGIPLSSAEEVKNQPLEYTLPFGVEAGVAFIQNIRDAAPALDIRVAFLGDEVSGLPADYRNNPHKGLEDLYSVLEEPENTVLLYLDIAETPDFLLIHHGTQKNITPLNVLEPLHALCVSRKIPYFLAVQFNELYKLSLVKGHPVIESAQSHLVNALYITGTKNRLTEGSPNITAEDTAALLADYAGSLQISAENYDYHFLILPILGRYFFISEIITIKIFLGIFSIFLAVIFLYFIIDRKRLSPIWYIFLSYIWTFPIFLFSLVCALEIGGGLILLIAKIFRLSLFINDFGWAGFKISIALLLFSLLFPLWNLLKIPKKADFYGNAAVMLVVLGIIIATALDITFTPIFLWIGLFTLLGAALEKPILVYLCALIAPVQALRPLLNILNAHNGGLFFHSEESQFLTGRLTEILLSPNIITSLYLALITLPFMLLFERGLALGQHKKQSSRRRLILTAGILVLNLGGLVLYTHRLTKNLPPEPVRRTVVETAAMTEILKVKLKYAAFLERRSIGIELEAKGNPLCFNLYLDTATPVIYSAPMPFAVTEDRKSVALILGEGPPNPFTTEIVLPLDFVGSLRVEALYTAWDPAVDTAAPPESGDYVLQAIKTLPLPSSE